MSDITTTEPNEDQTNEVCILDPGGDDRAHVPVTDADHTPAADPDGLDRVMAPVADALLAAANLVPQISFRVRRFSTSAVAAARRPCAPQARSDPTGPSRAST
jgi:hypothetical protein